MSLYRSICHLGLLVAILCLVSPHLPARADEVMTSRIILFRAPLAFKSAINQWSYRCELKPDMLPVQPPVLTLYYTASGALVPADGRLTVLVNEQPVASRAVPTGQPSPWRVELPVSFFKAGSNDIRLVARLHSYPQQYRDTENDANWLRLGENSTLEITRKVQAEYPLSAYPFPYLDALADDPVQATWVLPTEYTAEDVAAMLEVASDWGCRLPDAPLNLRVTTALPLASPRPLMLFGQLDRWPEITPTTLSRRAGWLWSTPARDGQGMRLWISGDGEEGLAKSVRALGLSEMVAQMEHASATIAKMPRAALNRPTTRLGETTFADLRYAQITIAGAFRQQASIYFQRPIRCDLGKQSELKIHFRHAAALDPARSLLTVLVNDIPVGSARLSPENAAGGVITAHIPLSELSRTGWKVDLVCYHEIGAVDSGKRYEDIAWTVIDGDSSLTLASGRLAGHPYLDAFPYAVRADGMVGDPLTCWLPAHPSDQQFIAAAIIAARAGQMNRVPLRWHVVLGDQPGYLADSSAVIVIGTADDAVRFASLRNELPICPKGKGDYNIVPELNLLPDALRHRAFLQAARSPWNNNAVVYAVIAEDDQQLARLCRLFTDPERMTEVSSDVCLFTPTERVTALSTVSSEERRQQEQAEISRATWPMWVAGAFALLVIILLTLVVARLFHHHPIVRPPAHPAVSIRRE